MIRIKSAYHNEYVVYDTRDFSNHHTHTKSLKVAKIIRSNVVHNRLPHSKEIRLLESHLRVATDTSYRRGLLLLIEAAEERRLNKQALVHQLMLEKPTKKASDKRTTSQLQAHYRFVLFLVENGSHQPTSYTIDENRAEVWYEKGPVRLSLSTDRHQTYTIKLEDQAIHTEEVRIVLTAKEAMLHSQRLLDFIGGE